MPRLRLRSVSSLALLASAAVACVAATGCSGDEPAPDCFLRDQDDRCVIPEPDGPVGPLTLSCGDIPTTAVNAQFSHQLELDGGSGAYQVVVNGLPMGLNANNAGLVSGVPQQEGTFMLAVAASDLDTGESQSVDCELTVNPALAFDPVSQTRGCLDVADFGDIRDGLDGGTGEAILCNLPMAANPSTSCPLRNGNGVIPAGITFDDATCTLSGSVTEDAIGTWVFMAEVTQSGATVFVPMCASREDATAEHSIEAAFAGSTDYLQPAILGPYAPTDVIALGGGNPGPTFTVRSDNCGGGACDNFAFAFAVACSPFCSAGEMQPTGGTCSGGFTLDPNAILNEGGNNTGFTHGMTASTEIPIQDWNGTEVATTWTDRPFVANWSIEYCTDGATCNASTNPETTYNYAVLAFPE